MNKYVHTSRKVMISFILLGFCILPFVMGCASTFQSECSSRSIYAATVVGSYMGKNGKKIPVRVAFGPTLKDRDISHAQAQAFIDGKWEFLEIVGPYHVEIGKKHDNYLIKGHLSVEDFVKWLRLEGVESKPDGGVAEIMRALGGGTS